ncbi:MAG TPA: hypothetical protein DC000_04450, partial [Clostridiales bacterium]|nr:hypothetical protein [Clostridiales bacterium]
EFSRVNSYFVTFETASLRLLFVNIHIMGIIAISIPIVPTIYIGKVSAKKPYVRVDNAVPPVLLAIIKPKMAALLSFGIKSIMLEFNIILDNELKNAEIIIKINVI